MSDPTADPAQPGSDIDLKPRPRGLWGLMRKEPSAEEAPAGSSTNDAPLPTQENPPLREIQPQLDGDPQARPIDLSPADPGLTPVLDEPPVAEVTGGRGLWGVMRGLVPAKPREHKNLLKADSPEIPVVEPPSPAPIRRTVVEPIVPPARLDRLSPPHPESIAGRESSQGAGVSSPPRPRPAAPAASEIDELPQAKAPAGVSPGPKKGIEDSFAPPTTPGRHPLAPNTAEPPTLSRSSLHCLAAGGASVALSLLALIPAVWSKIPATAAGFGALLVAMSAWNEISRSRGTKRGMGLLTAGALCGVVGMFLGPLVFGPLGAAMRSRSGPGLTVQHLESIGAAINAYHEEHDHFPPGGIFENDTKGIEQPMHGWMTALLPYLGEGALYESIHLALPYDHIDNRRAMRTMVPAFLAAGGNRDPVAGAMAPTHFAALGGEIVIPGQGVAHLGVFGKNSAVRRDDVADGLSNTLIAGEISHYIPPWGEPENWRSIGKGLNLQSRGFGNAEGTGALFLKADGSVQFFTNKISPRILEKLSTRDGGELQEEAAAPMEESPAMPESVETTP